MKNTNKYQADSIKVLNDYSLGDFNFVNKRVPESRVLSRFPLQGPRWVSKRMAEWLLTRSEYHYSMLVHGLPAALASGAVAARRRGPAFCSDVRTPSNSTAMSHTRLGDLLLPIFYFISYCSFVFSVSNSRKILCGYTSLGCK